MLGLSPTWIVLAAKLSRPSVPPCGREVAYCTKSADLDTPQGRRKRAFPLVSGSKDFVQPHSS